jgi:hypothetical protein
MKTVIGYRLSPHTISVTFDDFIPHILSTDHPHFEEIKQRLLDGNTADLENLVSPKEAIKTYLDGKVEVKGGALFYNGEAINIAVVQPILDLIAEDKDPNTLLRFLDRLMQNPSYRSRNQLWAFIERNGLVLYSGPPIRGGFLDATGWLVLYKGVNENYTDLHTGKFNNSVGVHHVMPRTQVDDDPNNGCSSGFHAGDYEYVKGFGTRKMVVLVDPANVGSVPADSSFTKLRTCAYDVIAEVPREDFKDFESVTYGDESGLKYNEDDDVEIEFDFRVDNDSGGSEVVRAATVGEAIDLSSFAESAITDVTRV